MGSWPPTATSWQSSLSPQRLPITLGTSCHTAGEAESPGRTPNATTGLQRQLPRDAFAYSCVPHIHLHHSNSSHQLQISHTTTLFLYPGGHYSYMNQLFATQITSLLPTFKCWWFSIQLTLKQKRWGSCRVRLQVFFCCLMDCNMLKIEALLLFYLQLIDYQLTWVNWIQH